MVLSGSQTVPAPGMGYMSCSPRAFPPVGIGHEKIFVKRLKHDITGSLTLPVAQGSTVLTWDNNTHITGAYNTRSSGA